MLITKKFIVIKNNMMIIMIMIIIMLLITINAFIIVTEIMITSKNKYYLHLTVSMIASAIGTPFIHGFHKDAKYTEIIFTENKNKIFFYYFFSNIVTKNCCL